MIWLIDKCWYMLKSGEALRNLMYGWMFGEIPVMKVYRDSKN